MQPDSGHIPSAKAQEALKRFSSNGAGPPALANAAKIPFAAAGTHHPSSASDGASPPPRSAVQPTQDPPGRAGTHQSFSSHTGGPQPLSSEDRPPQKTPASMSQTPSPEASAPQSSSAQSDHNLSPQSNAGSSAQQQRRAEVSDTVSQQEPEAGRTQQVMQLLHVEKPFVTPAGGVAPLWVCLMS